MVSLMIPFCGCASKDSHLEFTEPMPTERHVSQEEFASPESPPPDVPLEIIESRGDLSLSHALELALQHNPELKAISWDVRIAEAMRQQAGTLANPELEIEVEEFGGAGGRRRFEGSETGIQIGQPLDLARKREKRTQLSAFESKLAEWDYASKRRIVLSQVTALFVEVLAAQEQLALIDKKGRLAERLLEVVEQRVQAGKDSSIEKVRGEVTFARVQIEKKQAERTLAAARQKLAATWASKSAVFNSAVGEFDNVVEIPPFENLTPLVVEHPDMARWDDELDSKEAALTLEKARRSEDTVLFGGARYYDDTDDMAFVMGVSVPLPLFNQNEGNILAARYDLLQTGERKRAAEMELHVALSQAYHALSGAHAEVTALKSEVLPRARTGFDAVTQGYREGKFEYMTVLDAQRTLFEAEGLYVDALTAYHRAKTEIERLIGQEIHTIAAGKTAKSEDKLYEK